MENLERSLRKITLYIEEKNNKDGLDSLPDLMQVRRYYSNILKAFKERPALA
jgi:hypothetical protein